ncbi:hypothetical protein JCM8097_006999 [Rhodosporidiobolus ruineniae]
MASSSSPPRRPPLPTPPASPPTVRAQPAAQPISLTAHEQLYGAPTPSHIAYSPRPPRGSTFFVSGSGTQRLASPAAAPASRRPPLPVPPMQGPPPPAQASFSPTSSYAPPTSPGQLPPGARPLPLPGQPSAFASTSPTAATATTKVPLATSSSVLLHAGFYDILAAAGSRLYSPSKLRPAVVNGPATPWSPEGGSGSGSDPFAREMGGFGGMAAPGGAGVVAAAKRKKRISVDMVGRPQEFQHTVHASDADQAEALLLRWHKDRQGKVGRPEWAQPIKEAVRAARVGAGVGEVHYARDELLEDGSGLKVVNGLPDSVISSVEAHAHGDGANVSIATGAAVEDDSGVDLDRQEQLQPPTSPFAGLSQNSSAESLVLRSPAPASPLPSPRMDSFAAGGTTRFSPGAFARPGAPFSFDRPGALQPSPPQSSTLASPNLSGSTAVAASSTSSTDGVSLPSSFKPSLSTIECTASTKIFLESKYFSILKQPKSRETRKALLEKELTRLALSDRDRSAVRSAFAASETAYLRELRARIGAGSFVKLKTIGHGAFGVVSMVKEKATGEVYAMKQLRKADMLRKGQEGHIRAERDLLAAASTSTRWTVPLVYSFQDQDHLFLVMSYQSGGDLLSLLIEKDTFPEAMARFYIAEMVLAVEETHKVLGAIHRDIKPDNFLFDSNGHLAIADFGLACDFHFLHDGAYYEQHRRELLYKHGIDLDDGSAGTLRRRQREREGLPFDPPTPDGEAGADGQGPPSILGWRDRNRRRLAHSVVGTSNYMAVEVLRGTGYTVGADWWSVGVIAFEMLFGYPPFVSKSRQETKQKIVSWRSNLRFPHRPRISREAQDFICSLICEPENRLGSRQRAAAAAGRPNSVIVQKRSGFLSATGSGSALSGVADDGADEIKRHPFFRGIDWSTLHLQTPPFQPQLKDPTDTRYFDDESLPESPPRTRPATRSSATLSRANTYLLALRMQQAFAGWTYKRPKRAVYDPRKGRIDVEEVFGQADGQGTYRGRGRETVRSEGKGSSFVRSLSV